MISNFEKQATPVLKKVWSVLPLVILFLFIVVIAGLSIKIKNEKERLAEEKAQSIALENPPANVIVLPITTSVLHDRLNLPGIVEAWTRLQILAEIRGTLQKVPVIEGNRVKKGQLIAQVDDADYRIAVEAARAPRDLAIADKKRAEILFGRGLLPQAEFEGLDSRLSSAEAAMKNAELQLSRCRITAPISGIIQRLDAKEGLLLSVADPVAEILQIDRVKAVVGIPESDVDAVRNIDSVEVVIQALGGRGFAGNKYFLASAPENTARLYRLELAIDNQEAAILPGMFVRADIVKSVAEDALALPLYTVLSRNGEHFVYVEEGGIARRRPVLLGITEGWLVHIAKGLTPGDRVIVEGHRNVEEGHRVKVVKVVDEPGAFFQ
jgi:membrane fusion protein (multidrug efflux system)